MIQLDGRTLTLAELVVIARHAGAVALSEAGRAEMERSYAWVQATLHGDQPVYGINTGFGSLARVRIAPADTSLLSRNLIRSHAAGVGPACPDDVVRAMMLLRANALARGASGCRPLLVQTLCAMLGRGVVPRVPRQGSCGSSGDLAPLSHLALVVFGEGGEVPFGGALLTGPEAMAAAGLATLVPEAKDGLAMTNGAQLTTAIAALALADAEVLVRTAERAAAMSIEALRGVSRAFHPAVHALRPHPGAIASAAQLRAHLVGSSLVDSMPEKVQDAYSLRCTPIVLGATRDVLAYGRRAVEIELNSVTDNPVMLMDEAVENHAFSAGLFHGEPVGIAADAMKIGVSELASLSERRLYRLTTGSLSSRLPPGLAGRDRPDLGMLVPQTTAAALVSENKALAWPMSVDSIPTCEDQEDHVAMSTTAAWRLWEVVQNSRRVVAIELLCASRALRMRLDEARGVRLGAGAEAALPLVEAIVAEAEVPGDAIERIASRIAAGDFA
ncbi:MAG: histidine ammonia-lyase [Myxococcales bacterium]|nr:histidine ammonia-lyase [Myxococcales bacterium]